MKFLKELLDLCEKKDKDTISVELPKVRNQHLNNVLSTRKGGRHYDAKKDYVRAKEKNKARREVD